MQRLVLWLAAISWCAVPSAALAQKPAYEAEVRADVKVPMRDGVSLSANVFLPKDKGRFPVVLARTPYGKGGTQGGAGHLYAARGYVFVSQDCRGRGASGGEWVPFLNEARDGEDTRRWILNQSWCNGKIGTTGGSYVGFTQWASAPGAGDSLKAMFPTVPLVEPYGDAMYISARTRWSTTASSR